MANGNDNDDKIFVFITTAEVIPGNKIKQSNNQHSNHVQVVINQFHVLHQ